MTLFVNTQTQLTSHPINTSMIKFNKFVNILTVKINKKNVFTNTLVHNYKNYKNVFISTVAYTSNKTCLFHNIV